MVRVRNLVLAIAAASALTSNAFALGLGEVKVQSSLNQPLVAEIELLDTKGLGMAEIIPSLAPAEDFNRVGVDRTFFLSSLKFEPVKRADGRPVIRVTSSQPVNEPYLNFLVELLWPNGRLLREYTLLLDPPLYSADTVARVAPQPPVVMRTAPKATSGSASSQKPAAVDRPAVSAAVASTSPASTAAVPADARDGDVYRVTSRDTLWDIAQRSRQGGTVHQAMLAIQDLNPDAFVDGNINRMKSGQVLRLPSAEQVARRSHSDAVAEVAAQNAAWRQRRGSAAEAPVANARQLDATRRTTAADVPSERDQKDSLRLVAGSAGRATEGSEKGADAEGSVAALKDRLALTEESLDSSRRENAELKDRLEDLQAQLDKLQRLMQLKDDQLAQLQQQMAEAGTDAALDPVTQPIAPAIAEPAPAQPAAASEQPATETPASPVAPAVESAAAPVEPKPAVEPVTAPAKPKPTPVVAAPVQAPGDSMSEDGLLGTVLDNPLMLGVGGGALLLLLAGLLIQSRRKAMADNDYEDEELDDEVAEQQDQVAFEMPEVDLGAEESVAEAPVAAPAAGRSVADILQEVDTFIAYGRFSQATDLLQGAIDQEPQRRELRLKLLEVRGEMGDADGFASQEAELREIGGSDAEIAALKSKYPAVAGAVGAAAMESFDDLGDFSFDAPAESNTAATADEAAADDFDFSLDDLESQLGSFDAPADGVKEPTAESGAQDEDFTLDFDLPTSSSDEGGALPAEDPFADFSLDTDLDGVGESAGGETLEESSSDTFSFDLDETASDDVELAPLELGMNLEAAPKEQSEAELPEDFDLSLEDFAVGEDVDGFAAQLGEMDAELDALAERVEDTEDVEMAPGLAPVAAPAAASAPASAGDFDEEFDFLAGTDETTTKLDLARAYMEMGDADGARDILDEILNEGNDAQRQEAREMLTALS